jgi:hypothetical protein
MRDALIAERSIGARSSETYRHVVAIIVTANNASQPPVLLVVPLWAGGFARGDADVLARVADDRGRRFVKGE